jgi:hypothetical protein
VQGCGCAAAVVAGLGVGALAVLVVATWIAGAVLNAGPIEVAEIGPAWEVEVRGAGAATPGAAPALAEALRGQCTPSTNGLRVLTAHAWYNALTSGYDAQIWIEDRPSSDSYALYVWGYHVFLRDEVGRGGYVNRVLDCDLDAAGWTRLAGG